MSKKKILVTGSGGFILSNFVRYVLKNYSDLYTIISIDKCTDQNVLNTIYSNKGHSFHIADICDNHIIDTIFQLERPDYVIHGAAESFVDTSIDNPQIFTKTNVVGTQVIVDACVKYGVEKLIYISTDEVYGQLISEQSPSWNESSSINPRNPYSASKAAGELLVKAAGETFGLNYNITRSCNNFGPRQNKRNLIPKIVGNIIKGIDVPIYGKGEQIRDWIHVQDNCSAILKVLENGTNREIYNISAKQEFSNIEIFNNICNLLKEFDGHKLLKFVEDRKGHDFRYSITNTKLKEIGWEPSFNFKSGLQHTVQWYYNNQWIYR